MRGILPVMKTQSAAFLVIFLTLPTLAEELRGKVVSVADGDTITVLDAANTQHKVRLNGIDAPEKKQAYGTKSKESLSDKVSKGDVVVKWKEKDRYGRILGDVFVGEHYVNLEQIESGFAWHYKEYSKDATLAAAEKEAKNAKAGLWLDRSPTPPWEYRKAEKAKSAAKGAAKKK